MTRLFVNRFWWPPLLCTQSSVERALNLALPPLLWGILCGLLSVVSPTAVAVGLALSVLGAFGAGRQQQSAYTGLLRGVLAGSLFGVSVLAGHAAVGAGSVPFHPAGLQVAFTAAVGGAFAACGGWSR